MFLKFNQNAFFRCLNLSLGVAENLVCLLGKTENAMTKPGSSWQKLNYLVEIMTQDKFRVALKT